MAKLPLARIYHHRNFRPEGPVVLLSNHVDSVYRRHFVSERRGEVRGTLDNSACNAVVVELMRDGALPPQTLVAFTGDEEGDGAGADQTVRFLREHAPVFANIELAISLDLTEECFGAPYTIENYFRCKRSERAVLSFPRRRTFAAYLCRMLESPILVKDATEDESCEYRKHGLNCFSLCLPCRLLGPSMHSVRGVCIRKDSLPRYTMAVTQVIRSLDADLARRARARSCLGKTPESD